MFPNLVNIVVWVILILILILKTLFWKYDLNKALIFFHLRKTTTFYLQTVGCRVVEKTQVARFYFFFLLWQRELFVQIYKQKMKWAIIWNCQNISMRQWSNMRGLSPCFNDTSWNRNKLRDHIWNHRIWWTWTYSNVQFSSHSLQKCLIFFEPKLKLSKNFEVRIYLVWALKFSPSPAPFVLSTPFVSDLT